MANIGLDCKLYRGTAGSTASTEMKNVRDLTWNDERGEADISSRGSDFELVVATMRKVGLEWEMVGNGDADFIAIRTAYAGRTPCGLKVVDAAGYGLDADFEIVKFAESEPLNGAVTVSVSAKPTYVSRYPAAVTPAATTTTAQ